MHAESFSRLVTSTSRLAGVPGLRHTFVPAPVPGRTPAELRAYIEGPDPLSGEQVLGALVDGLTRPLSEQDMDGVAFERARDRLVEPDTEDNLQRLFEANGWTDSLPVVLPTEERVAAMLAGTSHAPDEVVGTIRAATSRDFWSFTVEQAAVNAVMAGARPEYFPVILALLASGYTARHSSISSIGQMVMVNGPIRHELGMNSGIGAIGPYNHANSTIGRSFGLGSQNLQGGSVPGVSYVGTIGSPFSLTSIAFAEDEEHSPWEPYHVQYGFEPGQSAATIFAPVRSLITAPSGVREDWRERASVLFGSIRAGGGAVLLADPLAAQALVEREGFTEKRALIEWIAANARMPARRWWGQALQDIFYGNRARDGVEPWATYLKADPDELIPVNEPDDVHVVVAGGRTVAVWSVFEGWANRRFGSALSGRTVAVDPWR
ncbi:hypothetical protein GCM10022254_30320 [Actinomadura meridiana]|uniref:Uncharacterized protein n=1 Tax=Actinomadura meridiana TaxID=559626 RepID=A0ABP8C1F3_9ACTN